MRVLPLLYMSSLTDDDIQQHLCSDRIWVSNREFERWITGSEVGVVNILQLSNGADQRVTGTLHGVHLDGDDIAYVPMWMYEALCIDTDDVDIARIQPGLCTRIVIQPHTSEHLTLTADPQEYFRDAFEQYGCVETGTTIPLWIGHATHITVTITEVQPAHDDHGPRCIRSAEVELELLRPLDYVTPPSSRPATPEPEPPAPEPAPERPSRELLAEAARRRFAAMKN